MPNLDIRVEPWIRTAIDELAQAAGRTVSNITRDLIYVGIAVECEEELLENWPHGSRKTLARFRSQEMTERLSFRLADELQKELIDIFGTSSREAFRIAMRLGLITLDPKDPKIVGPFIGFATPQTKFTIPKINDKRGFQALRRLKSIPRD